MGLLAVDQDRCCGSGQCVVAAPEVFDQREQDGIVVLREPEPGPALLPGVREAALMCPARAITLEEAAE